MSGVVTPGTDIPAAIAAAAAQCLRPGVVFDPDVPFPLLGLDSLGTIEMAAAIEERLGRTFSPELLLDCVDGRSLATRIAQLGEAQSVDDARNLDGLMLADATLPDDVQPPRGTVESTDLRHARTILLTGATGFLGGALLTELLDTTGAEIVCLVRRSGGAPRRPAGVNTRVRWIIGDLSRPNLGLGTDTADTLTRDVDAVLHCGAAVNWVYPYAALREANVLGTRELLRLACRHGIPFHFISSLSVCYPTAGPLAADESFEAVKHLAGLPLGYAQTKAVSEALVSEAGRRGLPVRIYRPALISGHSRTGAYNRDDLISALIRGCVRMGTAPDLDWTLDCEPVDVVARAVVQLSGSGERTFHLGNERPRHWRECVLWMRTYGYRIRLVPYHEWLRQLDRETAVASNETGAHPLRPLRAFFLQCPKGSRGLTLPELYEDGRRTRADGARTRLALAERGLKSASLNADLLAVYFDAFRGRGDLPSPPAESTTPKARATAGQLLTPEFLSRVLDRPVTAIRLLSAGSAHSIVGELTAWRSGRPTGLFHASVEVGADRPLEVRLKVKATDADTIAVGHCLADLIDPNLGVAFGRWSSRIGFTGAGRREVEVYRQLDRRFTAHAPALLGSRADDPADGCVIALEDVAGARLIDSAGHGPEWMTGDVRAAIEGLAAIHAIWYGREDALRSQPWIGHVQTTAGMAEMADLWTLLARHSAPAFSAWADPEIASIQQRLIEEIEAWWPLTESGPRTLIHHDFNPRNICLRDGRLCAYDWELACVGAPQRDLAELLCFVLAADTRAGEARHWIEQHRVSLQREAGVAIPRDAWRHGFRGALYDFMVNRLAFYALIHRVRRQPFLPRVVRTWRRLYELFPLVEQA